MTSLGDLYNYPKIKVGTILYPYPECTVAISELESETEPNTIMLPELFAEHLASAHGMILSVEKKQELYYKINFLRNNPKIRYLDPFLYVSFEELMQID